MNRTNLTTNVRYTDMIAKRVFFTIAKLSKSYPEYQGHIKTSAWPDAKNSKWAYHQ